MEEQLEESLKTNYAANAVIIMMVARKKPKPKLQL
jgi:hypothetical protein